MTSKKHDITIEKGATFSQTFEWYASSGGALMDVTSYSGRFQVRPAVYVDSAAISLTNSNGIAMGTTDGRVTVTITASDTGALNMSKGVYALEVADTIGNVTRLANGIVFVSDEVVR